MSLLTALFALVPVLAPKPPPEPERGAFAYELVVRSLNRVREITVEREEARSRVAELEGENASLRLGIDALRNERNYLVGMLNRGAQQSAAPLLAGQIQSAEVFQNQQWMDMQGLQQSQRAVTSEGMMMNPANSGVFDWSRCTCVPGRADMLRQDSRLHQFRGSP